MNGYAVKKDALFSYWGVTTTDGEWVTESGYDDASYAAGVPMWPTAARAQVVADSLNRCGPVLSTWFGRGRWPTCRCGLDPHDNAVLTAHWAERGFRVVDDHGHLVKHPIEKEG